LKIRYHERVTAVQAGARGCYVVQTTAGTYDTQSVLLAIGRRGTPQKLGVPGEELSKVVYRLIDPEQYAGRKLLVVGGGDSALETAATLAEQRRSQVVLSYRGEAFARATLKNRERVTAASQRGELEIALSSNVRRITRDAVILWHRNRERVLENDAVIVQAGGVLPHDFLNSIGVQVETKYGTA
jgi:thioredoxin reductase (NADPH)